MIRRAGIQDIPAIGKIINDAAEYGLMLHRSQSFLYEHVRDFHVQTYRGQVVGVCGLSIVWANLAEVYALVVEPRFRGRGYGKQLVLSVIDEAEELGLRRLMTLTYEKAFFEKLGFKVINREQLPLKVWSECVRCAKNQNCDEIAMIRELEEVPELDAGQPPMPAEHEYEVPVVLGVVREQPRREKMDEAG